jgi:hypothetical protein
MRKLTIEAISPETARGIYAAVATFDGAELLVDDNGNHSVAIAFADGDDEALEVITALRQFAQTQRAGEAVDVIKASGSSCTGMRLALPSGPTGRAVDGAGASSSDLQAGNIPLSGGRLERNRG